ncbi:MAG: STAS domain-containing protein [Actinobacteria bacterium]|nr:STAS domain-containing protein [Actinomycetota bacterium]
MRFPRRWRWRSAGPVRWTLTAADTAIVVIDGRLAPSQAAPVCAALHAALSGSAARAVVCRGEGLAHPDLTTVDVLARLVATARRSGCAVRIENPSERLRELIRFAGLELRFASCWSGVQPWGQPEQREQPGRVEESVEPDDHPV